MHRFLKTSVLLLAAVAAFGLSTQVRAGADFTSRPAGFHNSFRHPKPTDPAMDIMLRPSDSYKAYMSSYNTAVLSYAKAQLGQKIGDGQCWSVVDAALQAA